MSEPVRIVITLEGGLISAVCTYGVPVEALIIDYDTDGADPSEVVMVKQTNGTEEEAFVSYEVAEKLELPDDDLERFWP